MIISQLPELFVQRERALLGPLVSFLFGLFYCFIE